MAQPTLLAGDMGGTKTLLALYSLEAGGLKQQHRQRFVSAEWPSLEPMLKRFLEQRPASVAVPSHGCMAVAGPVRNRSAQITNLPWQLEEAELARAAGIEQLELVNDFGVLIYGLPHFGEDQQVVLQHGNQDHGPLAILGAGTGLGMARGLRTGQGLRALASEGGHREFAPRNETEWQLACWLKRDLVGPPLDRADRQRYRAGAYRQLVAAKLRCHRASAAFPGQGLAREQKRRSSGSGVPGRCGGGCVDATRS